MAADRAGARSTARRAARRRTAPPAIAWRRPRRSRPTGSSRARFSRRRLSRGGERSTAVTRAPACASCAVLPPGAAQRSATVLPRTSPSRRAGSAAAASCTHHAPSSKPGSCVTGPCGERAHRAGRQHAAVKPRRPCLRIALHREIERRLVRMRRGDGARGRPRRSARASAASAIPACRATQRSSAASVTLAFAREPPQHGVDQAGVVRGLAVVLREPHRKIDRRVVGHVEKQDLRRADQQRDLDLRRVRGRPRSSSRRADGAACRAGAARSRRWRAPARGRALPAPPSCARLRAARRAAACRAGLRRATIGGGTAGRQARCIVGQPSRMPRVCGRSRDQRCTASRCTASGLHEPLSPKARRAPAVAAPGPAAPRPAFCWTA